MEIDLDTFLVTVYTVVDDLYQAQFAAQKDPRGCQGRLSDSEVLSLTVLAQWHPSRSERAFLRFVRRYWREYFPRLTSQSAFNRRAREMSGVLLALGPAVDAALAAHLGEPAAYQVVDGVPVPLARRCRGRRQRAFGPHAAVGRGGADKDFYYGVKLLAAVRPAGTISGFGIGPANTEERWLLDALLRWRCAPEAPPPPAEQLAPILGRTHHGGGQRIGPTGPRASFLGVGAPADGCYVADWGLAGAAWQAHWRTHSGACVLTKAQCARLADPTDRAAVTRWLCGLRQAVETTFNTLTSLGLAFPRARSYWGLLTRLAAKVVALNLGVYLNHLFGRPPYAVFNPIG